MKQYGALSPSGQHPMTWTFAFASPWHCLASFGGSGVLRPASGTWGTLAGLLVYMAVFPFMPLWMQIGIIVAALVIGAKAAEIAGRNLGVHDHSSIVIDEVFAIWAVLMAVPDAFFWQMGAFAAFRFFDIVKIWPANYFDQSPRWHNGWGVMLDDAVAAVQPVILLRIVQFLIQ